LSTVFEGLLNKSNLPAKIFLSKIPIKMSLWWFPELKTALPAGQLLRDLHPASAIVMKLLRVNLIIIAILN